MTPQRRRILERYIGTGNAKACGVSVSRVRRIVREACDEYGCNERTLVLHLAPVQRSRKAVAHPDTVQIWTLGES